MKDSNDDYLVVGRFGAVYGVRGWIKLLSFTEPYENILHYKPWFIKQGQCWRQISLVDAKKHGKAIIVLLENCHDREFAKTFTNAEVGIEQSQLETLDTDEYYWRDLVSLTVVNNEGVCLGKVEQLINTGANDILVIKGEKQLLVPFIHEQYIKKVDLDNGLITVDWDPEF